MHQTSPRQHGIQKTVIIAAIVVVGLFILAGVLLSAAGNQARVSCDSTDKRFCQFVAKWANTKAYRVRAAESFNDGSATNTLVEVVDGGRTTRILQESAAYPYEAILIGNTAYIKDNSAGGWWKQDFAPADISEYKQANNFVPNYQREGQQGRYQYKAFGTQACDNRRCYYYQVTDPNSPGDIVEVWFDTQVNQLRRLRHQTQGSNSEYTFTYDDIRILTPTPVKALRPGQSLVLGANQPVVGNEQ